MTDPDRTGGSDNPLGPDRATSRRAFLRLGFGKAAAVADGLLPAGLAGDGGGAPGAFPITPAPAAARPAAPSPARQQLDVQQVLELARAEGLAGRLETVRRHLRVSLRLSETTDGAAGHGSWLWGTPPPPTHATWPAGDGIPLVGLCHLDLDELARAGFGLSRPPGGGMTVLMDDRAARSTDPGPVACGAAQVVVHDDARLGRVFACCAGARPALLTPELVLPRVWVSAVQELDLAPEESDAWTRLRSRVAALQHVTLFDQADEPLALHRVRGYADERVDLAPEPTGAWELLLQVTVLGSPIAQGWPVVRTRVHLWIGSPALARGDFADVRVTAH